MTIKKAKETLELYFKNYLELRTYAIETDYGIITKEDLKDQDNDTLIWAAQDAEYELNYDLNEMFI